MARPDYTDINNGSSSWDATVNDNYQQLRDSIPFPEYLNVGALTTARPPAQNEGCAAAITDPTWEPYWCDGVSWIPWPATLANHASTHENGGADEINVAGLNGVLADPQTAAAHAASHQNGGADEIATATPAANAIPKADGSGTLDAWVTPATPYTHPNHTGDVTSLGDGAQTIANNAVTNAKAADMAANTVKARNAGTSGDPVDVAVGTNTVLGRQGGDIVSAQVATAQVSDDAITNAKLANMAQALIKGRAVGAGTGDPTDLTPTQATAILNAFTSGLKGLAPASGGGTANFLRADGSWVAPTALFGSGYHNQSTAGPLTTTSTSLVTLTTYAPAGGPFTGTYRLGFRVEFNSDTPPNDAEVELRRTDGGAVQLAFNEEEPLDGDDWNTLSFFASLVLAGTSPTFDVRARTAGGAGTISIRKIEWEWWRVL